MHIIYIICRQMQGIVDCGTEGRKGKGKQKLLSNYVGNFDAVWDGSKLASHWFIKPLFYQ